MPLHWSELLGKKTDSLMSLLLWMVTIHCIWGAIICPPLSPLHAWISSIHLGPTNKRLVNVGPTLVQRWFIGSNHMPTLTRRCMTGNCVLTGSIITCDHQCSSLIFGAVSFQAVVLYGFQHYCICKSSVQYCMSCDCFNTGFLRYWESSVQHIPCTAYKGDVRYDCFHPY